ncbi:hypothetical protein HB816_04835 [Listeria booriae]|uniref:hypothetical protein n=1 Tax=Listeria booriae TaxID=1552123 RepID=UPI0016265AD7|nr:hypothetical protein [Listeria booriae]MBC1229778.1 hypothetical protein [Listeria booriae]MBC1233127.1 hypothetical protein [Listeria booriae]
MELPKHIITKIKKAGYYDKKARDAQTEVREWLEKKLTNGDELPDYIKDQLIDALEHGVDGSSGLIEFLMEYETGEEHQHES